jgi:hypothetical protein
MKLEIALLNELFGPDPGKKLVLGDDDPRPFDKRGENFKRSSAERTGVSPSSRSLWWRSKRNGPNENSLGVGVPLSVMGHLR